MSLLAWSMMAIALWHFTVYLPDKFLGGIVGAFAAGLIGAIAFGFVVNGFEIPGRADTDLAQAFIAIPGTLIGLGVCYWLGLRSEAQEQLEAGS